MEKLENFIPAAHYHFLTPAYEFLARLTIGKTWRGMVQEIVEHALQGAHVTDIGCGPGTILRNIREKRPDLILDGFDIDPSILKLAERKAKTMRITFAQASTDQLPIPAQSRDIVMNNMVFHHLTTEMKRRTFDEVRRVLRPDGSFLLCDFSSFDREEKVKTLWSRLTRFFEPAVIPQMEGQLFTLAEEAGARVELLRTYHGSMALLRCTFPQSQKMLH